MPVLAATCVRRSALRSAVLFLPGAGRLLGRCGRRGGKVFSLLREAKRAQLAGLGLAGVALGDIFGHCLLADGSRLLLLLEAQVGAGAGSLPRVLYQDLFP